MPSLTDYRSTYDEQPSRPGLKSGKCESPLSVQGKTIVFTGKISRPRHEFEELVVQNGGIFGTSVTKNTDYLVVGEKPGSKLAVAALLGTKTISEQEFMNLLTESTGSAAIGSPEVILEDAYRLRTPVIVLNGFLDHPHLAVVKCVWCNKAYQIWDDQPNYATCPMCEMFARPVCPKCHQVPVYVTTLSAYYCRSCYYVFEGPHSENVYYIDHVHVTRPGHSRCILCGRSMNSPTKVHPGRAIAAANESQREEDILRMTRTQQEQRDERNVTKQLDAMSHEEIEALGDQLKEHHA